MVALFQHTNECMAVFQEKGKKWIRGKIIHSEEKGLEMCSGCGYIYNYIYIHPYGTIVEFQTKQMTGLTKPTKHTHKNTVFMAL